MNDMNKYPCSTCNYEATQKDHLITHIGVVYSCNECDFKTARKSSLWLHKRTKHDGRIFKCDQCDIEEQ